MFSPKQRKSNHEEDLLEIMTETREGGQRLDKFDGWFGLDERSYEIMRGTTGLDKGRLPTLLKEARVALDAAFNESVRLLNQSLNAEEPKAK